MNNDLLKIRNLTVSFGKHTVLESIDLSIPKNRIIAIIGASGCGKSTLLKALNRTIEEVGGEIDGEIVLDEVPIRNMSVQELRKEVGLVFQMPIVFPFSIYKNITYGLKYHFNYSESENRACVEWALTCAGLYDEVKDLLDFPATKLSGGQQQRLAIARAIAIKPKVLLLDEPCSSLDVKNTKKIEEMLQELKKDYTIIIVTHNLAQAKRMGDQIVFMDSGHIVETGDVATFFESPSHSLTKEYLTY